MARRGRRFRRGGPSRRSFRRGGPGRRRFARGGRGPSSTPGVHRNGGIYGPTKGSSIDDAGSNLHYQGPGTWKYDMHMSWLGRECFVAGTKVIMKDGPDKNIEDIKTGDEVLSYNVNTKQLEPKQVTELFTQTHDLKDGDITVKITFDNGTLTHNTIANPFWSKDKGFVAVDEERCNRVHAWVKTTNHGSDIESLETGDTLFAYNDSDGELEEVGVENIEYVMEKDIRTYDIHVEDNHTFFANGILTHNSSGCFQEGTMIEMGDGKSFTPIENIVVGDIVKTFDISETGDDHYSYKIKIRK